jgi:prophage regulatory protein
MAGAVLRITRPCLREQYDMAEQFRQFLRLKQIKAQIGLGRTSIYDKIKAGEFPKPYPLGPRAVGWLAEEIDAWIESRIKAAGVQK